MKLFSIFGLRRKKMSQNFKVKDMSLAEKGRLDIQWAESRMPVLMEFRKQYGKTKPLRGHRIAGCLHVTKETAVLIETLREAGAEISWSGCNPLSTNDAVAAALAKNGISVYAWHGLNRDEFYWCIEKTLEFKPTLTLDDGADLIMTVHTRKPEYLKDVVGGTEETTTGVHRLRAMAAEGALKYPVIAINDAETKWDFDNVYGTGQSSWDGVIRATSVLIAG
jgi:adenosylhomocysteinase